MPFIIPAAIAIASAVASAVAVISSVVAGIVMAMASVVILIAKGVATVIAATVLATIEAVGLITLPQVFTALQTIGLLNTVAVSIVTGIVTFVAFVATTWKAFAEFIHLKTLLAVHEIAYLVSIEYRAMINALYQDVAELSNALGLGSAFIPLAIRNARAIVLDASTAMGKSYDLAELTWLYNLSGYMEFVSKVALTYRNHPERVFEDLDRLLIKPAMDGKAAAVGIVLTTVDNLVTGVEEIVNITVLLRDDLEQFISDLPKAIQDVISPALENILDPFNDFISNQYGPAMDVIDQVINVLHNRFEGQKEEVSDIINRLRRPGDLIYSITSLPEAERADQESKIYNATSRIPISLANAVDAASSSTQSRLQALVDALNTVLPANPWLIPELPGLFMPIGGQIDDTKTWFVGDY